MKHVRAVAALWLKLVLFFGVVGIQTAQADDYTDVAQLTRAGKHAEALARADQFLSAQPKDAQMRFLRGVALLESGKSNEALALFTRLADEFPDLPEPHNNAAVVYANQGQFDRARNALETAIKTNSSYATAYENLGDVYARLASQAYGRALQLENASAAASAKLDLIRDFSATSLARLPRAAGTQFAQAPTAPGTTAATTPKSVTTATAVAPRPAGTATAPTPPSPAPTPVPVPVTKPSAASAMPTPPVASTAPKLAALPGSAGNTSGTGNASNPAKTGAPSGSSSAATAPTDTAATKPAAAEGAASKEVETAVRAWAAAWSAKNVAGYLSAYSRDFDPPGTVSRSAWEAERRQRITSKGSISVKVDNLQIQLDGSRAIARFRQDYKASGLAISSRKTLELQKTGAQWKIVRESVGS